MGVPKCKRELEGFQGMVNYPGCYSSQLTQVAELLKELLGNDMLWVWKSKHKKEFEAIKEELTKTLFLPYFDSKADHIIQEDGSIKGLGAVLLQKNRPVIYVSRTHTSRDMLL